MWANALVAAVTAGSVTTASTSEIALVLAKPGNSGRQRSQPACQQPVSECLPLDVDERDRHEHRKKQDPKRRGHSMRHDQDASNAAHVHESTDVGHQADGLKQWATQVGQRDHRDQAGSYGRDAERHQHECLVDVHGRADLRATCEDGDECPGKQHPRTCRRRVLRPLRDVHQSS